MKIETYYWLNEPVNGEYDLMNCFTEGFSFPMAFNAGIQVSDEYPIKAHAFYETDLKFICDYVNESNITLYEDEDEYLAKSKENGMGNIASESILPTGTFNGTNEAIINCQISKVFDNNELGAPDNIVLLYGSVYGNQMDIMIRFENAEARNKFHFKAGQYLTLECLIEIWPESDTELISEEELANNVN